VSVGAPRVDGMSYRGKAADSGRLNFAARTKAPLAKGGGRSALSHSIP
jgi:hypothetical protein